MLRYKDMAAGQKNDPPGTPVGPYAHGPNGLFNVPGTNTGIFSLFQLPLGGAMDYIPVLQNPPTETAVEGEYGGRDQDFDSVVTGVTSGDADDFDNQPTGVCDPGPVGGLMKLCTTVNQFGRLKFSTREVHIVRAGQLESRAEPTTLQILNQPGPLQSVLGIPSATPSLFNVTANEMTKRLFETAVSARRMIAPRVYTGTPSNNSGAKKDWIGLDLHINKGTHIDKDASAVCTAADSLLLDFQSQNVAGTTKDIIEMLDFAVYALWEWKASRQGMTPVDGILFMRPELWQAISDIWPIRQFQHSLNQMAAFANGRVMVDGQTALNDRNAFRLSHMLPIRGKNYMVVEDDAIPFTADNAAGTTVSDIYGVAMSVMGGMPTTYWQYWNHENANSRMIQNLAGGNFTFTSDSGMFRWYTEFKQGCFQLSYEFNLKLKVKAPQLCFRIQNVLAHPLLRTSTYDPNDSSYFVNGGVTQQPANQYYTAYSPTTPVNI